MISAQLLIRLFLLLVYLPFAILAWHKFLPHLRKPERHLAIGMLSAQVFVIVMALQFIPTTNFERWLWHLDAELNIPAGLAATQLSLVALFAFASAWWARALPKWQRLYFVCISSLFAYLAHDEFFTHSNRQWLGWEAHYAALGAVVALATLVLAARASPHPNGRIWHILLVVGLAVSGFGALVVENFRFGCVELPVPVAGCIRSYLYEEILEFAGIWLALVAMLGQFSLAIRDSAKTWRWFIYLSPLVCIALLLLPILLTHLELSYFSQPASVKIEVDVKLEAYRIERQSGSVGLMSFLSSKSWHHYTDLGYSLHLVDQVDGASITGVDQMISRRVGWGTRFYAPGNNYRQWVLLEIPPEAPRNRAYWIVLTFWRQENGEFIRQKILSSDQPQLGDTQLILDEMLIQSDSGPPSATTLATFDNGFALEAVELPACLEPGETVDVNFAWRANSAGSEDFAQFLHFIHAESGAMWNHDQMPLGSRLPTRLWYSGLADSEMWRFSLPSDLPTGEYSLFTGLYRHSDLERARAHSPDGSIFPDARVSLGSMPVQMAC